MITLVYGGSSCGKSEYAESMVIGSSAPDSRYYIATMKAYDEEGLRKIRRHRKMREGKGFKTIECHTSIEKAMSSAADISSCTFLLECIPNLVANEMFDSEDGENGLIRRITEGLGILFESAGNVILVTDNVFEDGIQYDNAVMKYMEYLGTVNTFAASRADSVYEVVAGIPIRLK
ncbi:MAG: bifunctional adenosylcobinamide kinase/adenosylcobinamide-phosphate guanylyltransferase [Parasporobacterium sp.]|nr:bifunctional adenosylcobinamide kinase/adenosylcobinamide-phosphate guanylyltransferase [Parasporobacterium sp.]